MKRPAMIIVVLLFTLTLSSVLVFALSASDLQKREENYEKIPSNLDDEIEAVTQLNEVQLKAIEDFKSEHSLSMLVGSCPRQEALLMGKINSTERRITLEEVKQAIKETKVGEPQGIFDMIQYPDFEGGSGMTWLEYWIDDDGSERIIVYPTEIRYVSLDTNGEVAESQTLFCYNSNNSEPKTTNGLTVENTFAP